MTNHLISRNPPTIISNITSFLFDRFFTREGFNLDRSDLTLRGMCLYRKVTEVILKRLEFRKSHCRHTEGKVTAIRKWPKSNKRLLACGHGPTSISQR